MKELLRRICFGGIFVELGMIVASGALASRDTSPSAEKMAGVLSIVIIQKGRMMRNTVNMETLQVF